MKMVELLIFVHLFTDGGTLGHRANWKTPGEIKREYPSASFLANNRVVFNIKGNKYRLIVRINYDYGQVWIRFIGTHAEYDTIDASTI